MFFRRKSSAADLQKAVDAELKRRNDEKLKAQAAAAKRAAPPRAVPPQAGAPVLKAGFSDSTMEVVINDLQSLPPGQYLRYGDPERANIPVYYESMSAVLVSGQAAELLRTPESVASRAEFDISNRLIKAGFTVRERHAVTPELLQGLHDRQRSQTEGGGRSSIQDQAFSLIEAGVMEGASDIHIATRESDLVETADVYFRIHGERIRQNSLTKKAAIEIMRVLYNVHADEKNSGTNWDPSVVQDTAIEHRMADGGRVQVRFNSAPIYPGKNVQCTMRLLRMDGAQAAKSLEQVGYTPEMVAAMEEMLIGATGLVLLVGPTNSGKSTTIQSLIARIYKMRGNTIKVVTIEDPVEYIINDACQMGVPRGKLPPKEIVRIYNELLASTLRQDPDVALVGEIRTAEQAEPVKDMVLAGRKILSTLHAYEAMAIFPRLREIGIPESLLTRGGFISGVIYQRLVPVVCPHCSQVLNEGMIAEERISRSTYNRVMQVVSDNDEVRVRSREGCKECHYTGIISRTPCAEILVPDDTFLRHIRNGDEVAAKNHWHATGINTDGAGVRAIAHAIAKMRRGLLDPTDIESQIGTIQIDRPETPVQIAASAATDRGFLTGSEWDATSDAEALGLGGRNSAFASAH